MNAKEFAALRKSVSTPYGEIAYVEKGAGPVALFVHGILLNGFLWRDSLEALSDTRRCIAIDILGHGATETPADINITFDMQSDMIESFLDALGIDQVDLVANDSGGGISQIFAANHPERIRTLVLTNSDTHDNYPPEALNGLIGLAKAGALGPVGKGWIENPDTVRAAFGTVYENPDSFPDENVRTYLGPIFETDEATKKLERFLVSVSDNTPNVRIEPKLRQLQAPTLIIWGTDDVFFETKWAYWLKDTIPGAREVIEAEGARLFFPEERHEWFTDQLRNFWSRESKVAPQTAAARA